MTDSDLGPLFAPPSSRPTAAEVVAESQRSLSAGYVANLGEKLKRDGMERADAHEGAEWKAKADAAIAELAATGAEFTAEQVRARAGDPARPNAMGARFGAAAKAGLIKYVRHQKSARPSLHACAIRVWVGVAR